MDFRPICNGEVTKNIMTKAVNVPFMNKVNAGSDPSQFLVGMIGSGSQLVVAIARLMEGNPDWVIITSDVGHLECI